MTVRQCNSAPNERLSAPLIQSLQPRHPHLPPPTTAIVSPLESAHPIPSHPILCAFIITSIITTAIRLAVGTKQRRGERSDRDSDSSRAPASVVIDPTATLDPRRRQVTSATRRPFIPRRRYRRRRPGPDPAIDIAIALTMPWELSRRRLSRAVNSKYILGRVVRALPVPRHCQSCSTMARRLPALPRAASLWSLQRQTFH